MKKHKVHVVKCWPEYFEDVWSGIKTFELRKDDRDYESGDHIEIQEYDPNTENYSGRVVGGNIPYVLKGPAFGLEKGHCICSLSDTHNYIDNDLITRPNQG